MDFAVTEEQERLRAELRQYFAGLLTPEKQHELWEDEMGGPVWKQTVKQIAADGWLGIGWPKEYGGQDRSPIEQLIFFDEAQRAEAPVPMLSINTVGPTIMRFGTDDQRQRFLPGILAGDLNFAIGYTEPGSGTDLASLKTRAVRDGDEYVVNGQKIFTSLAKAADYVWLAARTDPDAPKHKGISIFLMPTDSPGFTVQPLNIMGGADTTATFYDNVRIPVANRVGDENQGWSLITTQLNHERVAICNAGLIWRYLEEVSNWARATELADGARVIDQEWVRLSLARVRAAAEVLQLMNWKVAWGLTVGDLSPADASATKVFGTHKYIECLGLLMEIVGPVSYLRAGSPEALLRGRMERSYQGILVLTFGGGTNEIQRDIIAMLGLGMPAPALMASTIPPAIDFGGKRVVVTGAASGIGAATADLFAALGADVVRLDVADGSLDLRDPVGIDATVAALAGTPTWALVNCAGVPQTAGGTTILAVNFLGTRHLTEALVPQLVEGGAVVTVASLAGQAWAEHLDQLGELLATPTFADGLAWVEANVDGMDDPYFFSKEAVILWTRRRARSLRHDHAVRMSTISPGPVESPMMPSFRAVMDEAVLEWTAREAIGRMARPDEMALPLVFLCAPGASYVSGIDLVADAGFTTDLHEGLVDFEGLNG